MTRRRCQVTRPTSAGPSTSPRPVATVHVFTFCRYGRALPYYGDPDETRGPEVTWRVLTGMATHWKDSIVITPADEVLLRRAVAIAAHAITLGDAPYGSLLADADGTILIEAHNTVRRDNDISAHPELKLARWAARELDAAAAARTAMYTSCQPCQMCTGGIARSGLGRVVYALSVAQLSALNPGSDWAVVTQEGPALFDEARIPIEQFYQPLPGP